MVSLKHDDKLQEGSECAFQCALLYSTLYGQRRIRVSTLSLPCINMLSNLFRSADLNAHFTCMLKQAANEIPSAPLAQVRDQATNVCINILYSFRKFCATVSSSGQLILPEALKLLPLYVLALLKSSGLRSDEGVYLLENGEECLIYVGNSVQPNILQKLFGISSIENISSQFVLQQLDNPLSKKVNAILNEIRRQ